MHHQIEKGNADFPSRLPFSTIHRFNREWKMARQIVIRQWYCCYSTILTLHRSPLFWLTFTYTHIHCISLIHNVFMSAWNEWMADWLTSKRIFSQIHWNAKACTRWCCQLLLDRARAAPPMPCDNGHCPYQIAFYHSHRTMCYLQRSYIGLPVAVEPITIHFNKGDSLICIVIQWPGHSRTIIHVQIWVCTAVVLCLGCVTRICILLHGPAPPN
jgi:hypothetical protein